MAGRILLARGFHAPLRPVRRPHHEPSDDARSGVLDMRDAAETLVTQIQHGRGFNETGAVPRLGPPIARWFGETIAPGTGKP